MRQPTATEIVIGILVLLAVGLWVVTEANAAGQQCTVAAKPVYRYGRTARLAVSLRCSQRFAKAVYTLEIDRHYQGRSRQANRKVGFRAGRSFTITVSAARRFRGVCTPVWDGYGTFNVDGKWYSDVRFDDRVAC